ncbi:MAG: methyltransferase C-terminal domain-containing protein [Segetibacter sp.]
MSKEVSLNVDALLEKEINKGMNSIGYYDNFQQKALKIKLDFTEFLIKQKKEQKKVAAYGAAAKGNTLLNFCGIKNDLIKFVVDANPYKQNKYLPASHIPVVTEDHVKKYQPDFVIIFPWNIKEEVMNQMEYIKEWGGRFVIPIPGLQVI